MPPPRSKARRKNQSPQPPDSADDFLAAGVEFEEAGEKWRAGDAAKSLRFFQRALDNYDVALDSFPGSFDLAYNRARVLYQITLHPSLLNLYPADYESLLKTALDAHALALRLDPHNTDALFNSAQVSSSLAAALQDRGAPDAEALNLYESALDLFSRCLAAQESLYAEQKHPPTFDDAPETPALHTDHDGGVPLEPETGPESDSLPTEEWATIVEPVTVTALLDTAAELLETLSELAEFVDRAHAHALPALQQQASILIEDKIPAYLTNAPEDLQNDGNPALPASIKCQCSIHEAAFRLDGDSRSYDLALKNIFVQPVLGRATPVLIAYSEAWVSFAVALVGLPSTATLRWNRLTSALEALTEASRRPGGAEDISRIHIARGDVELIRFGLCSEAELHETLRNDSVRATTLKNAGTFYVGAIRNAEASRTSRENGTLEEATIKSAITQCLVEGSAGPLQRLAQQDAATAAAASRHVRHMSEDGVLSIQTAEALLA